MTPIELARAKLLTPIVRWSFGRKASLCRAIEGGIITRAEAMTAHGLSDDEMASWLRVYRDSGMRGLVMRPVRGRAANVSREAKQPRRAS